MADPSASSSSRRSKASLRRAASFLRTWVVQRGGAHVRLCQHIVRLKGADFVDLSPSPLWDFQSSFRTRARGSYRVRGFAGHIQDALALGRLREGVRPEFEQQRRVLQVGKLARVMERCPAQSLRLPQAVVRVSPTLQQCLENLLGFSRVQENLREGLGGRARRVG
jgi:hypothetical protein